MTTTLTIRLSDTDARALDAYVSQRNTQVYGRPLTAEDVVRQAIRLEIGTAPRSDGFWAGTSPGSSPQIDPRSE